VSFSHDLAWQIDRQLLLLSQRTLISWYDIDVGERTRQCCQYSIHGFEVRSQRQGAFFVIALKYHVSK